MFRTKFAAVAAATALALSLAACGSSDDTAAPAQSSAPMTTGAPMATTGAPSSAAAMDAQFGAGCAAVPTDPANPGSFDAMAKVPVASAASGNPLLSTLVAAVKQANLVDSLNNAKDVTVFAPTNDAFKKIPQADLGKVMADSKMLTSVLTYHVVPGKLTPAELAGTHKTLQGTDVTVTGSGTSFTVNGNSMVVCGNVQTANAVVYIVDTVLMPKS
ncbi:fasciclin domain-containing protein [Dactylosporangium matsuzakiense]|uniref:Lipoprotein n=1 Tax=Dactylosporangium matsuzakiense TaxID=53360 RepID=A0A9W6KK21_9ACTN|nr:fasciclin domain-containing protein [Dactylosporangium matsuzakiense]UWZ48042.1 fasciclin domain-containing protein [Dactylosporangium matsuzakiense]GLL03527.1 lipoprotein [Dactylosporangium matsuzakiense]